MSKPKWHNISSKCNPRKKREYQPVICDRCNQCIDRDGKSTSAKLHLKKFCVVEYDKLCERCTKTLRKMLNDFIKGPDNEVS